MKQLSIHFTENAGDEVRDLFADLKLLPIVEKIISQPDQPITGEVRLMLADLINNLAEMFSTEVPVLDDTEIALRKVSRDINIARLLRERGLYRFYKVTRSKVVDETTGEMIPSYMTIVNPDTGVPFLTQEEFIGWFCREASVSRGLVFQRMATIDRVLSLGFTDQQAFKLFQARPFVIRETLKLVADAGMSFNKAGDIEYIDPQVASQITRKINPELADHIDELAQLSDTQAGMRELVDEMKPVLAELLNEVATSNSSKEIIGYVKHDLLMKPEVKYLWNQEGDYLMVQYIRTVVDRNGAPPMVSVVEIPFIPDIVDLPIEVKRDLCERLPIANKHNLDLSN